MAGPLFWRNIEAESSDYLRCISSVKSPVIIRIKRYAVLIGEVILRRFPVCFFSSSGCWDTCCCLCSSFINWSVPCFYYSSLAIRIASANGLSSSVLALFAAYKLNWNGLLPAPLMPRYPLPVKDSLLFWEDDFGSGDWDYFLRNTF